MNLNINGGGEMKKLELVPVEPQPTYIDLSGRWCWPLPEQAIFPGCCTEVVTASREWWEYAPSGAKPHPMAEGVRLRDNIWYWAVPIRKHKMKLKLNKELICKDVGMIAMLGIDSERYESLKQKICDILKKENPFLDADLEEICECCDTLEEVVFTTYSFGILVSKMGWLKEVE